ncbi:cold-shock protein [Halalkalibacter oceani]|uniref:cold-shock protein n=1 Tax=Halalkalibacter oceani TaxID=1653776 RepID=UPI0033914444
MSDSLEPRLQSFQERRSEPEVWAGGEGTGDEIAYIEDTGYRCPRKEVVRREKNEKRRLKWYDEAKGFGFTTDGLFVHFREIEAGTPKAGAIVECEVKESAKGKQAVNVIIKEGS